MTDLNGRQRQSLHKALLDAFPTYNELRMMVTFGMNENLAVIAGEGRLDAVVFDMIQWAEARGCLAELITAARNQNPGNLLLRTIAEELHLATVPPPKDALERILHRASGFQNVAQWRQRMGTCESAVCRVEYEIGGVLRGIGTGFLVSPDLVMTNWHVMKDVFEGGLPSSKVLLRFDYKAEIDGVTVKPGQEYRLTADWDVDHSPPDALDYSLLRVEGAPGEELVGGQTGAPSRGWLLLKAHTFEANEPLIILQHPQARPLQLAFGSVLLDDVKTRRVHHDVNTEPGSSGSPCFDSEWNVVALHHYGATQANRAIPSRYILQQLDEGGKGGLLPP